MIYLDGEATQRASKGPAIRNLHSAFGAIVGIVNLRGIESQGGCDVAHHAHQQARILVEKEAHARLALTNADQFDGFVITDFVTGTHPELAEYFLEVERQVEIRVQPHWVDLGWADIAGRPSAGTSKPTIVAVVGCDVVPVRRMHDRDALVRSFGP